MSVHLTLMVELDSTSYCDYWSNTKCLCWSATCYSHVKLHFMIENEVHLKQISVELLLAEETDASMVQNR